MLRKSSLRNIPFSPALKSSFPLLVGMFITKCVAIGLSLIPVLIVDLHLDKDTSALTLTMIRGALLAGPIIGGYLIDIITPRRAFFVGMLGSSIGMFGLSMASNALMVVGFGVVAQLCQMIMMSTARFLLMSLCKPEHHVEALGWFRTVNNGAQIFSYSLGWGLGHFGLPTLFLLDGITSLLAFIASIRLIPRITLKNAEKNAQKNTAPHTVPHEDETLQAKPAHNMIPQHRKSHLGLWKVSVLVAAFGFLNELFYCAIPAKLRLLYGANGVSLFSSMMLINVIICTALTLFFSKHAGPPRRTLLTGLSLFFVGVSIGLLKTERREILFLAFLIVTLGELIFQSLAQYVVMQLVPDGKKSGSIYGLAVSIHAGGRLLGASVAFPLFVYSGQIGIHPAVTLALIAGTIGAIVMWSYRSIPLRLKK